MQVSLRVKNELKELSVRSPKGVFFWSVNGNFTLLEATITGPEETPYENGIFKLELQIPSEYPFKSPTVRFITPVYHPNIDYSGAVFPGLSGSSGFPSFWTATCTISSMLVYLQFLLQFPNFDCPVVPEIAEEYKNNRPLFRKIATEWTKMYAIPLKSKERLLKELVPCAH